MRTTRHQLQKLIREELASMVDEGAVPVGGIDPCKLEAYAQGEDEYHQRRGTAASRHCPTGKSLDRLERNSTMPPHKTRLVKKEKSGWINPKETPKETTHPSTYREAPMQEELEAIIKEEYKKLLEEHAKDYVWGVKAPYSRTANQYKLSVLKKDLIG